MIGYRNDGRDCDGNDLDPDDFPSVLSFRVEWDGSAVVLTEDDELDTNSDGSSFARDVNDVDTVAGQSAAFVTDQNCFAKQGCTERQTGDDGVFWLSEDTEATELDDFGRFRASEALDINDSGTAGAGQLVGWGSTVAECAEQHAIFWDSEGAAEEDINGNLVQSRAYAINGTNATPHQVIVGTDPFANDAVIWEDNGSGWVATSLGSLTPCEADINVDLRLAADVNEAGWILVDGLDSAGDHHLYALVPIVTGCEADVNGDGVVGVEDLILVLVGWTGSNDCTIDTCWLDTNGDCNIDQDDLDEVIDAWEGATCGSSTSIQTVVEAAGLDYPEDWDHFLAHQDENHRCWMEHYLMNCPCWGHNCPGPDPYD